MPVQYAVDPRGAPGRPRAGRAVRPVAHGRAVRRGPGGRRGARRRARHGPAGARRRPRPLLDDLRARRRHHRRPDRLPPRPRTGSWSSPTPATRRSCPTRSPSGSTAFRAVLDDRSLATGLVAVQGPRSRRDPAAADRRRPRRRCATTRSPRATVAGHPGAGRPDRLHRRGRLRGLRRRPAGPASCGTRCSTRSGRPTGVPVGLGARDTLRLEAGMPLYGNELDRDDEPVRRRPRAGRQARQAGRLRRPRGARAGRRDGPAQRLVGLDRRGPRHRPPRLPGPCRRAADRRRDQRDAVADARRADRDGLRRARRCRAGYDARRRDPRRAGPRRVVALPFYQRSRRRES